MSRLEIDSVMLEFGGRTILSDVYMCFETGRVTGILGRNGTGKSCLLKIIFGTLHAQYATVRFDGNKVVNAYKNRQMIRYLPQRSFIPGYLTLGKVAKMFCAGPRSVFDDFPDLLDAADKRFSRFSFGEKRLIETLLVLKSDSQFVLLDEPFSFLMPSMLRNSGRSWKLRNRRRGS